MEDELRKLRNWASHGTLRQFYAEISAKASLQGYLTEMEGNSVTCYKVRKEGGFLGIGRRTIKEPVLKAVQEGNEVRIPDESVNAEFVHLLAPLLKQH